MIRAAGILFHTKDGQVLFLKRSALGDHTGEWCFPGGKIEDGETPAMAAARECLEEVGYTVDPAKLVEWTRSINQPVPNLSNGEVLVNGQEPVDFTTFAYSVDAPFDVKLNEEHTGFSWSPMNDGPEPMHPGCRVSLARSTMTELDVAQAIADGRLTSPQRFINMTLFDIRITGTGAAYRRGLDEFVWRDSTLYLNQEFLARCNGLPVIMQHPKDNTLNSKEFGDRVVGTILYPYIKGDEVWGVARIYDDNAIRIMSSEQLSTSPGVVFKGLDKNQKLTLENGSALLIEGKPSLIDHVAICALGVWDKLGDPNGINTAIGDSMAEKDKEGTEVRADAEVGGKLDQIIGGLTTMKSGMETLQSGLDALASRVDSMEEKMADSEKEDDKEKDKADSEDDKEKDKADSEDDKEKDKADSEDDKEKDKADSEDEEDGEKPGAARQAAADKAKADSAKEITGLKAEITRMRKDLGVLSSSMPKGLTDADYAALTTAQAKADGVYSAFGDAAPRPLQGEDLPAYRRRLATGLKAHSKAWKEVDLSTITDGTAFDNIESVIYNDAMTAAHNPTDLPEDQLRQIVSRDVTGRQITTFHGRPRAWMGGFAANRRRLGGIRNA